MLTLPVTLLALKLSTLCPTHDQWRSDRSVRWGPRRSLAVKKAIRRHLREMGVGHDARQVAWAIVTRESHGDRCAVHVLGAGRDGKHGTADDEFGLGPAGLFVKFHIRKWDATADPRELHRTDVTAHVIRQIFRNAKYRYRAKNWMELGEVFAGRVANGRPDVWTQKALAFCRRLEAVGVDCEDPITGI